MTAENIEKRSMTCIVCPVGCRIDVEFNSSEVLSVTGNTCKRGEAYARSEIIAPVRTLTSTVAVSGGEAPLVPVKTNAPIPKKSLFEAMKLIDRLTVQAPVELGCVIAKDFIVQGVDLVACKSVAAE